MGVSLAHLPLYFVEKINQFLMEAAVEAYVDLAVGNMMPGMLANTITEIKFQFIDIIRSL